MTDMRPGPPDSCLGEGLTPFQDGDLDREPGAQFDRCLGLPDDYRDLVGVDAQLDTPTCGVRLTSDSLLAVDLWRQRHPSDDARGLPGALLGNGRERESGRHPRTSAQRLALGSPGADDVGDSAVGIQRREIKHGVSRVEAGTATLGEILSKHDAATPEGRRVGGTVRLALGPRGRDHVESSAPSEKAWVVANGGANCLVQVGRAEPSDELAGAYGVARGDEDVGEQPRLGSTNREYALGHETTVEVDGARDRNGEGGYARENARQPDGAEDATPGSLGSLRGRRWTVAGRRASECPTGVGDRERPPWRLFGYAAISVHGWAVMEGTAPARPSPLTSRAASRTVRSASAACSGWWETRTTAGGSGRSRSSSRTRDKTV